jgi:hypothetical protein
VRALWAGVSSRATTASAECACTTDERSVAFVSSIAGSEPPCALCAWVSVSIAPPMLGVNAAGWNTWKRGSPLY